MTGLQDRVQDLLLLLADVGLGLGRHRPLAQPAGGVTIIKSSRTSDADATTYTPVTSRTTSSRTASQVDEPTADRAAILHDKRKKMKGQKKRKQTRGGGDETIGINLPVDCRLIRLGAGRRK